MNIYAPWLKENLLAVLAIIVTLIFFYQYVVEKEHGIKLSRKYRDSLNEVLSKIFLNATQFLIMGNKDLAIKEFQNAIEINKDTLDTYFALGRLYRSNGEIEKAIHIHRSIIARESITESIRLAALKELAIDFDKGGFVDKAIETYKDVLRINRDQSEVIESLCRIYENVGDWEQAYYHRIMLSKLGQENQSETISQILVEKAISSFESFNLKLAKEDLEDALRFAPSLSAKILRVKIYLFESKLTEAQSLFLEVVKEDPEFTSFLFLSLEKSNHIENEIYKNNLHELKQFFLQLDLSTMPVSASVVLAKIRLLKEYNKLSEALNILEEWMGKNEINLSPNTSNDIVFSEYIKLLIENDKNDLALNETKKMLANYHSSLSKHFCSHCGFNSDEIFWRCPQCHNWKTIQFRWKV